MAALVAASTCVMAGALLQAAALVALQRYWQLTACWAAAIASAALLMLAAPWGAEHAGAGRLHARLARRVRRHGLAVGRTCRAAGGSDRRAAH